MLNINYQKCNNQTLLTNLEEKHNISKIQNYQPILNEFLLLNDTNYNNTQLENNFLIHEHCHNDTYKIKNITNKSVNEKEIFFKISPILNPYKFFVGKYDLSSLHVLPKFHMKTNNLQSVSGKVIDKIQSKHNSSYTESFFVYLSCKLLTQFNFINGIEYYGSFLGIKNNFTENIYEDLEYLCESDYFLKEKNNLFTIDDKDNIIDITSNNGNNIIKKNPISIGDIIDIDNFDNFDSVNFDDIFQNDVEIKDDKLTEYDIDITFDNNTSDNVVSLFNSSLSSSSTSSTCSSRTSHTCSLNSHDSDSDTEYDSDSNSESVTTCSNDSHKVNAIIPNFPVNLICMEKYTGTLEQLIDDDLLTDDKWFACLMQIIMSLITYQKMFSFTHNDLHTNNVMFKLTKEKFIYYKFENKIYKVPTFGRIFTIIDFGRSIYKVKDKLFCSDCFDSDGDANSQYNTEPFFNDNKQRLEPNYSFDLCRLACSIFDFIVEDIDDVVDLNKISSPLTKLIVEWCMDDKGNNVLYKKNGDDRYPDFKLYKMIARHCNNHTPVNQLSRKEFKKFITNEKNIKKIVNIDIMGNFK